MDTRTAVYSLGVMLYELLVGAFPFDSRELRSGGYEGIRKKIREEEPRKPSTRLSILGDRSIESARRRRVATDIGRYLAEEPVLACPPSAAYRARKSEMRALDEARRSERVSIFLRDMLVGVSPERMGNLLLTDLREQARESRKAAGGTAEAIASDPDFAPLRGRPGFEAVIKND